MYGIALTVQACLRAGTRADVAWLVEAEGIPVNDWSEAMVFTPGGGRIGSLAGGVLDAQLADLAGRWSRGRLVDVEVTEVDALIAGLPAGGSGRVMLAPADIIPARVWDLAESREPIWLLADRDGQDVESIQVVSADDLPGFGEEVEQAFRRGRSGVLEGAVVSVFHAMPTLVVVGDTPVGQALASLAEVVGWRVVLAVNNATATGAIAGLSPIDKVLVAGHDLELTGGALMAALESNVGYVGALGAHRMQETRADWLAYRGVTDLSRIHGPAGLDIGADTPAEIAVSILAEAIELEATRRAASPTA